MLLRISLIVAILAAIAAGVINFVSVKTKIETVVQQRDTEKGEKEKAQTELATTKRNLDKTTKELDSTKTELASTKEELGKAQTEVTAQTQKAAELTDKLAKSTQELNDTQAKLAAYVATGFSPDQIVNFGKQLKQVQDDFAGAVEENRVLSKDLSKAKEEIARFYPGWRPPVLPAGLKGKVLVTDPKWNFVVIDVGEKQEVKQFGEMLVTRNGKLVAKVSVRSVEPDRCIANILPEWKLGEVLEGDTVISVQPPT
jgi:Skp family chaperone for outer membrane proteins